MAIWQCDADTRQTRPAAEASTAEETAGTTQEETGTDILDHINACVAFLFPEVEQDTETTGVAGDVRASGAFTTLSALSFMLFNILCAPCFAACGAIRREMNSSRWTWFAIGYMTLWAYVIAFITYQLGLYFTCGTLGSAQVLAGIMSFIIAIQAVRPNPHTNKD